jgi:hypothetical protein
MKKLFSYFGILIFSLTILSCSPTGLSINQKKQQDEWEQAEKTHNANQIISSIVYMKDPRTNLCFAYIWNGPALANVPCVEIPINLLTTASFN